MTVPNRSAHKQKKNLRRIPPLWITTAVIFGVYIFMGTRFSEFMSSNIIGHSGTRSEDLLVYDWIDPNLGSMKQHMEFVHMDTEVAPRLDSYNKNKPKFFDINYVHQNALLHTGIWAAVIDTNITDEDAKILLLKRGPQLVTCPSSWGLLGEHTYRDETSRDTVVRGLKEELGSRFFRQFLQKGAKTKPLLKHPVFFHKDFRGDGSVIDRQMTYLYAIEMNTPVHELQDMMRVDDEVADVKWMTRQEIQDGWMNYSPHEKFCSHELAILLQLVLHRIEDFEKEANAPRKAAEKAAAEKKKAEEEEAAKKAAEEAAAAKANEESDDDDDDDDDEDEDSDSEEATVTKEKEESDDDDDEDSEDAVATKAAEEAAAAKAKEESDDDDDSEEAAAAPTKPPKKAAKKGARAKKGAKKGAAKRAKKAAKKAAKAKEENDEDSDDSEEAAAATNATKATAEAWKAAAAKANKTAEDEDAAVA